MNNMAIYDAKKMFAETGRLNKNIVREEIGLSWYKCYLAKLSVDSELLNSHSIVHNNQNIVNEKDLKKVLNQYISNEFDYYVCDENLNILDQRTANYSLEKLNSFNELYVGTNAGSLYTKYIENSKVEFDEHYLTQLSSYCSYSFGLFSEDVLQAVIIILSKTTICQSVLATLETELSGIEIIKNRNGNDFDEIQYSNFVVVPESLKESFESQMRRVQRLKGLVVISGEHGSGKTSLALYLSLEKKALPVIIDLSVYPESMVKVTISKWLFENETVIFENVDLLTVQSLNLIEEYIDNKIYTSKSSKYSNYSCSNVVLITANSFDKTKSNAAFNAVYKKYIMHSIEMCTLEAIRPHLLEIIKQWMTRYSIVYDEKQLDQLVSIGEKINLKDLNSYVRSHCIENVGKLYLSNITEEDCSTMLKRLDIVEKNHIETVYKMVEQNITIASEVLGIGRSTLYRKLEKYQIETHSPQKP